MKLTEQLLKKMIIEMMDNEQAEDYVSPEVKEVAEFIISMEEDEQGNADQSIIDQAKSMIEYHMDSEPSFLDDVLSYAKFKIKHDQGPAFGGQEYHAKLRNIIQVGEEFGR